MTTVATTTADPEDRFAQVLAAGYQLPEPSGHGPSDHDPRIAGAAIAYAEGGR